MTWIRMMGENGIDIYQYPRGTPRSDSLYVHINPPHRQVIFIDGDCEVEGELAGRLTIVSSGDMYLLDNIRYRGSDRRTGWFEEGGMYHMLGLVSEGSIIIEDNERNGSRNGGANAPGGDHNRHSIAINGSLIALGGSFTFEHHNDEWDAYQGPEPDERGYIYLKGSIAQFRRGYVHRANHAGTGYGKSYNYDFRLGNDGPPGFGPGEYPDISGYYEDLLLIHGPYTIQRVTVENLQVEPGVELNISDGGSLTVLNRAELIGTENRPIEINSTRLHARTYFRVNWGVYPKVDMRHVNFSEGVELDINCDSLYVNNCRIDGSAAFEGNIQVDSSRFAGEVQLTSWGMVDVSRSVFENGVIISGNVRDGNFKNNTVVNSRSSGIVITRFTNLSLRNNIIAYNDYGIVNRYYEPPDIAFNDVYANRQQDWEGCEPGEGSFSDDPLFLNHQTGNYQIAWNSPCVDAGDPDSPPDRDGSRADMGAIPYIYPEKAPGNKTLPEAYSLEIYPNPFNSRTNITCEIPERAHLSLKVLDISGRRVYSLAEKALDAGSHIFNFNAEMLPSGLYYCRMEAGADKQTIKLALIR